MARTACTYYPHNYDCSAQLKGGALGFGALFPRPALESMWAMVTSLRGGGGNIPYVPKSERKTNKQTHCLLSELLDTSYSTQESAQMVLLDSVLQGGVGQ